MLKNYFSLSIVISLFLMLTACKDQQSNLVELDLLQYGAPIVIKAPAEAVVTMDDLGFWKDITVQKGEDFYLQIISTTANTLNASKVKAQKLEEVKNEAFFSKIIEEEDYGFIYEKKIDDVLDYDFRYVRIQGDMEYTFQTGLLGTFTEDQVRQMYAAVK